MSDIVSSPVVVLLQSVVTQIGGYFAFVGLLFLVLWVWGERRFARYRIQKVKRFSRKQLRHELLYTLVTFVAGIGSAGVVVVLHSLGRTSLIEGWQPGHALAAVGWIVGIIVFNDAWFYFWHRLLHTPAMFRRVHAVHHKSVDVNPFSSYSFHAFEGFILGAWIVPAAICLPIPMPVLFIVQVIGLLNNVNSHLGYEFLPSWWVKIPPFSWTSSSTFHNLHHQKLNGNYGLFFRFWDRLLSTDLPGYEQAFRDRSLPRHREHREGGTEG